MNAHHPSAPAKARQEQAAPPPREPNEAPGTARRLVARLLAWLGFSRAFPHDAAAAPGARSEKSAPSSEQGAPKFNLETQVYEARAEAVQRPAPARQPMQFLVVHPAAEGSYRWRMELAGRHVEGRRTWLVISTIEGTRIEIPIERLAGDIECCNGTDAFGMAIVLMDDEQLQRSRAEAERFYGPGGTAIPTFTGEHHG